MKSAAIIVLLALVLFACKKENDTCTVNGVVSDVADNHPVAGLSVELQAKLIGTSTYQSSFSTLATTTSDGSGSYSFSFEKTKATVFRIRVTGNNYQATETEFSPEALDGDATHTQNIKVPAYGWITIHVINQLPADATDELTVRFVNIPSGISNSCSGTPFYFAGLANETLPVCFVPGGLHLIVETNVHIGANYFHSFDTVLIPVKDTLSHTIQF